MVPFTAWSLLLAAGLVAGKGLSPEDLKLSKLEGRTNGMSYGSRKAAATTALASRGDQQQQSGSQDQNQQQSGSKEQNQHQSDSQDQQQQHSGSQDQQQQKGKTCEAPKVSVTHVNDKKGFYTCDCVEQDDKCLTDGECKEVAISICPELDGEPIPTPTPAPTDAAGTSSRAPTTSAAPAPTTVAGKRNTNLLPMQSDAAPTPTPTSAASDKDAKDATTASATTEAANATPTPTPTAAGKDDDDATTASATSEAANATPTPAPAPAAGKRDTGTSSFAMDAGLTNLIQAQAEAGLSEAITKSDPDCDKAVKALDEVKSSLAEGRAKEVEVETKMRSMRQKTTSTDNKISWDTTELKELDTQTMEMMEGKEHDFEDLLEKEQKKKLREAFEENFEKVQQMLERRERALSNDIKLLTEAIDKNKDGIMRIKTVVEDNKLEDLITFLRTKAS